MSAGTTDITVRRMRPDDRRGVIQLLCETQRWVDDERFDRFFVWKHEASPFGASRAWVATAGERIVGFRPFLRWDFDHPDGRTRRAVRAVDASTHPEFQRRGIFDALTRAALDELAADGIDFVFNTPNDKSGPGELKLGWVEVGRIPTAVRAVGIAGGVRMLRSQTPAARWSLPSDAGADAREVLADPRVEHLLDTLPPARGLRTHRTAAFLRWRYRFPELAYRACTLRNDPARGLAIFRVRPRGSATEAALCDVLVPAGATASTAARALEREVVRTCGADYVMRLGVDIASRTGFVRLPRQGPTLMWRPVAGGATAPRLADLQLQLGDVELF